MSTGFDGERLQRVTELCDRYVNDNKFPCAQIQISHRGKVVLRHTAGKADMETGRDLHENAIFRNLLYDETAYLHRLNATL